MEHSNSARNSPQSKARSRSQTHGSSRLPPPPPLATALRHPAIDSATDDDGESEGDGDDNDDGDDNEDQYYEEFSDSDLLPENLDDHYDIRSSNVYQLLHTTDQHGGPGQEPNEDFEAYRKRIDSADAARLAAESTAKKPRPQSAAAEHDDVNIDNILAHLSSDDDNAHDPSDVIGASGDEDDNYSFSEDEDPTYTTSPHDDDDDDDSLDSQEEYEQEHRASLRATSGVGRRSRARARKSRSGGKGRRGGRRRNDPNASPAVQPYILAAQSAYFDHNLDAAMAACHQALFVEPKADLAYRLMGIIHESRGDMQRAMRTYMVMAHLIPKDYDIWRKVAVFARQVGGSEREMMHCYRKAMGADPKETVVPWKLIMGYEAKGQVSAKVEVYRHLLRHLPFNMLLVRDLVRIHLQRGNVRDAAQLYWDALNYHARGQFKHPWTPPTEADMHEKVIEGNDPMLERITYRKRHAREAPEGQGIDPGTGAATLDDLLDAARVLLDVKRFADLVVLVKRVVRWFQGRIDEAEAYEQQEAARELVDAAHGGETVDETELDAEYDPVAHPRPALHPDFPDGGAGLPLDFRVILGVCRLQMGQLTAGKRHFEYLASLGVSRTMAATDDGLGDGDEVPAAASAAAVTTEGMPGWSLAVHELYQLVWQAYMDAHMYSEAVPFLDAAIAGAETLVADAAAAAATSAHLGQDTETDAAVADWIDTRRPAALAAMYFARGVCLARLSEDDPQVMHVAIQSLEHALVYDQFALEPREELAALYQKVGNVQRAFQMLTDAEALIDNKQVDSVLFARRPDMRGKTRRARAKKGGEPGQEKRKRGRPKGSGRKQERVETDDDGGENDETLLSPTAALTPSVAMFPDSSSSAAAAAAATASGDVDPAQLNEPTVPAPSTEATRLSQRGSRKVALAIKEREMKLKFSKLSLVGQRFDQLDARARRDYLASAASLYETFRNTAAFYPSDRTVTFAGVDASGRIRNTKIQHARFVEESEYQVVERRMFLAPRARYNPEELAGMTKDAKLILQAKSYLGYSLDQWFDHLMLYCVALVKNFQSDLAFKVLHDVADANIFWHDNDKMVRMHIIGVSLAVAAQRPNDAAQYARWLVMNHPYTSNVYRIYAASMCSGTRDRLAFASTNCQKFFKRMLVQRFSGTIRTSMTPAEVEMYGANPLLPVKDEPERMWSAKPLLLTLYGHILSCAASYLPAITHYVRAYALSPTDPMVNFALGSAYLHRAMQRKSDNRHLQIAQGLAFMFRYAEYATHPKVLVMYNLGRAFHQIGLVPLASRYYRLALEESASEVDVEDEVRRYARYAAYNLALVYQQSNSVVLARRIMQEYLTV
ncbi:hypothetical protein BCR44DRAFT_148624, partial [Catenaria anguillulae PL171]